MATKLWGQRVRVLETVQYSTIKLASSS